MHKPYSIFVKKKKKRHSDIKNRQTLTERTGAFTHLIGETQVHRITN